MIMGYGRSVLQYAHLLSLVIISVAITGTYARYGWKTGLWRECQHHSCGRGGIQHRTVYCGEGGEYNYDPVNEEHCRYMPKPKEVRECFKVCDEHLSQLRWVTTTWSECALNPYFRECAKSNGIQYRNVTCAWRQTGRLEDDSVCSEFEAKPPSKQQCDLKCPQDCVVSQFSEWQYCDTCKFLNKTRTRHLILPPANGGKECPAFTEMIPCKNCTDTFTYKIGPWDKCSRIPNQGELHPFIGFQKRNIRCLNSFGSIVGYKSCKDHLSSNTKLTQRQTCVIPQDCVVSSWSPWKPLNTSCIRFDGTKQQGYMVRTRSVKKIPLGTGAPCPDLVHYFEVEDSVEKNCPKTKWITSSWGECEVPPGSLQCTTGLQTRNTICIEDEHGIQKPTSEKFCTQSRPMTSQICRPECDLDCTVSQWTEWSECKVTECELYARRRRTDEGTGQRYRTRDILMENSGSGARCPHWSETQMCDPQPCYHWNISVEKCMLLNPNVSPPCGLGTAYRTLACVNKLGLRVSDSLCEELVERPDAQEDCNIPCPRDCILSSWSPWSDCPNMCQEGRTSPAISIRQRTVLAQPGRGGAPCPPNRQLEEAQPCPTTIECAVYVWQYDAWSKCVVKNKSMNCGDGIQTRDVNCYSLQGQLVSDQRCALKVKPDTSRGCMVPCPLDCVLTDFSDWSDCSATCWEAKQTVPVQTRLRYVLQTPRYGGQACPAKMTDVRQCMNLPICQGYSWEVGPWSRCILPLKIPQCGTGLMAREVTCKSENGTVQPFDLCIRHVGPMPPVSRPCYRSCDEECVFEEWSEWSQCVKGCNGNRFRTRKLIEDSEATPNPMCLNRRRYPIDVFERCLCDAHTPVTIGNWSQCILEPTSDSYYKTARSFPGTVTQQPVDPRMSASLGINAVCGPGKRYKVLACQNDKGEMEAANQCSLKPYEEDTCLIPCPVDCIMSDWSLWSDCSTSCETGSQMRYRHIKQKPSDGGRQCPSLDNANKETQTKICTIDCHRYRWRTYKWSICMPLRRERQCGNGTQSRVVRCEVLTSSGYTNEAVSEQRCYGHYKPQERRECYSPCVGECVVSEWSGWSKCSQPCTSLHQIQVRKREILRSPILSPGNRCPDLLEERLCVRGENCIEYSWQMSPWTSCLVNSGMVECGPGHRHRYPICRDHRSRIVESSLCQEALGDSKQPLVESCKLPCDVDCLLTEWSPWTECSTTCGIGQRSRERATVQEPKGHGRVCPTTFHQTRPCFEQGCYTWVVSPWAPCMAQQGVCGHGIQTQNVSCIADGGLPVNTSNCAPDPNVVVTKEPKGHGRVCPTTFHQTRPCFEQGCYTWVVSPWAPCMAQQGVCGHGIQTQNVSCIADGGLPVNTSNCAPDPNVVVTKMERSCYVPCPGECLLTEWTKWTDCFIDCKDYKPSGFTRGVQSRSRAVLAYALGINPPCPEQLWESRPCEAFICHTFIWHTSPWNDQLGRKVWCERSDGMKVTGGCSEINKPAEFLECNPPCTVDNSYCNDTDYCVCKDTYDPVFDRLNALVECVMDNSSAVPVSPKTVSLPEDGVTNVWMYAVIAAGTFFVIFLAVGCYTMSPKEMDLDFVDCFGRKKNLSIKSEEIRYSDSEYIHKGPRSRKKEEKKNAEGGENVDGMIAETTLVSCNHIAPIATRNDLDTVSVISADRSSTDSVRACNGHALAEGCAKLHEAGNELDFDHLEWNDSVVKVNGNVHRVHDIDVVNEVDNRTYNTCMLPKSKSSSTMSARSPVYSVVHKDDKNKTRLKGTDEIDSRCEQTARFDRSFSEQDDDITEVKKARSDIELSHFTNDKTENRADHNTMHDIKSPSLRNLVQSFIGKIDKLSPKKEGDTYIRKHDKEIVDNDLDSAENELTELVPLLVDPDDSGLASAPSPHIKLQQETPAGPGSMFCPSCGQKQSDMSDISLESYDRTSSLRSYNSLRSDRLKSLSRNTGPVIQIIPKELALKENQNTYLTYTNDKSIKPLEKLLEAGLPSIAKQTVISNHNESSKVGYVAFSSFDTETSSVAPSTSVSNGSLESAADDIASDLSAMETNSKHHDQTSDKSRNVAIYSLRQGKQHGKPLKEMSPEDSGIGASIKLDPNLEDVMDASYEITGRGFTGVRNNAGGHHPRDYNQQKMQTDKGTLDNYGLAQTNGMIDDLNELNGKETHSLIAPSAFEALNIKTKRQALRQAHSCGKLDISE